MYNMKTKTKTMKSSRTDRLTLFLNWTWTYKATTFLCEQMRKREREKKIEFWVTKKPHGEKALRLNFGWFLYGHFPHTDRLMFHVSLFSLNSITFSLAVPPHQLYFSNFIEADIDLGARTFSRLTLFLCFFGSIAFYGLDQETYRIDITVASQERTMVIVIKCLFTE